MKKSLLVSAAALALAAATTVAPVSVSAAPATGQTTAEFKVEAGGETNPGGNEGTDESANLWLVKAPNLHFETAKVADIIAGGVNLKYDPTTVNSYKLDSDTNKVPNDAGKLQVSDLRGNGAGWTLFAAVSAFTNHTDTSDTNALNGTLNLNLNNLAANNIANFADQNSVALTTGDDAKPLWTAQTNEGQGVNTADVAASTSLDINQNALVKAAQYDATITWTLASTALTNL